MTEFESSGAPPEREVKKLQKVTREEVDARLARGEDMEDLDIKDLDLAGFNFEEKKFRGSDIRGAWFYGERQGEDGKTVEIPANLRRADFTDATIGDFGPETIFGRVEAEGAIFGFTEDLISRRNRHNRRTLLMNNSGERPGAADSGGYYNFNGGGGNFRKTKWSNIDFGGGSGYEAFSPARI
jgi:uncharacterized protein YjbI with pentapeptide repeats